MDASPAANGPTKDQGTAVGLRLQALLAQHTVLAADMMRARMRHDPDFVQAAETALTRNTQALSSIVGTLGGNDAARQFSSLWTARVTALVGYADAAAAKNPAREAAATQALSAVEARLGRLVTTLTKGRLPAGTSSSVPRLHVGQLQTQADAYAAGRYAAADAAYQQGFQQAFATGGVLATALLAPTDASALATPSWQLRTGFTQLLGEHVALVVAGMRAASGQAADFDALGAALNRNTLGITGAVDTLYGAGAAHAFQSLWADHVDALMAYTAASAKGDQAAMGKAQARLRAFEPGLAALLNTATQSRIGADALAHAFAMHDEMLVGEVAAYQNKDYVKAHDLGYQAYDEMFDLSGQLSHAIELTLKGKLPKGGSQTGGGGMWRFVSGR